MSAQPSIIQLPLSQLRLSAKNSRKKRTPESIERIAASLKAHDQLQNLVVSKSPTDDFYEVDAGGTRLAAFQLRLQRGEIQGDHLVDCKVVGVENALELSTAENVNRDEMHPADQFDAFKDMVEAKKSIPDIAAHFSVSPLVVKQRLKLAKVAPKLVQIYRDGGMDLAQLQTLALTDDQKLQEKVWFGPKYDHERSAMNLRRALTDTKVRSDNVVARFVGIEEYEKAGGLVISDLFSERGDAFLADRQLLDSLAMDKLEAIAERERNEGWSWVVARISADYDQLAEYPHSGAEPKFAKPGAEENSRIKEINTRLKEIEVLIDADDEAEGDDQLEWEDREALTDESEALEQERRTLSGGKEIWPADIKGIAGVVVFLDNGGLRVVRGRLQPGQKVDKAGGVTGAPIQAAAQKAKKPELSQDMVLRLEMHRAAAIREHIAANPAAALTLLLATLVTRLITTSASQTDLGLSPRDGHGDADIQIRGKFSDLGKSPARKAIDDRIAQWKKDGLPGKAADLYAWIEKQSDAKRAELLALATALTLGTPTGARGEALAARFGVDMATWWQPTPSTYLELVPKALLAEAVIDVAGKPAGEAVLAMKKDGAMAEAAKRLTGTGWLPKPLRGADYKLGKAGVPKPSPTAKAAVKPAKKAAAPAKKATKKPAAKKPAKKAAKAAPKKAAKK